MADHYDAILAHARQSLAYAQERAAAGDWMAEHEVETLQRYIREVETEAAMWRDLTPEEKQRLTLVGEALLAEWGYADLDGAEGDFADWLDEPYDEREEN